MTRLVLPRIASPVEPRPAVRGRAQSRSKLVAGVAALALVAIAVRGAALCVRPSERVVKSGIAQRYDQVVLRERRGEIYDRDGRRLATSVDTPSVAVDPSMISDDERHDLATRLAAVLDLPVAETEEKLARPGRYVKLAGLVHPAVATRVEALDHPAVWTHRDAHRYYPEETLASQLLGFVDSSGTGRSGLEEALDEDLRGGAVVLQRRRDRRGMDVDTQDVDPLANRGRDIHTTIDRKVQHIAERALERVMITSAPLAASALVVEVRTGDILAMANAPTFNPNAVGEDATPTKNHLVTDAIEPGSVFKPFTIAAAVEEGVVQPDTLIDCEGGAWAIGRSRIRDDHPHGVVTVGEVMKFSSNIGTAKLAFRLGPETFLRYLHRFGFGERTGLPLPGERQGRVREADTIKPIEMATTAFGQGVTTTPLQLAMGVATIANGGVRMKPRLVTEIVDAHGVPEAVYRPTVAERAISEETARKVGYMMALVTEEGGTGTRARVPGYAVAGKTGTAQKVKGGHYSEARVSSFVGFVPVEDPVVAIVVVVDEVTRGSRYGGIAAAPAFAEIAAQTLRHLGVPPDPALLPEEDDELPVADLHAPSTTPLRLEGSGGGWTIPDLHGRSLRDVLVGVQGSGLALDLRGSGLVASQSPAPGERLAPGGTLSVVLQ